MLKRVALERYRLKHFEELQSRRTSQRPGVEAASSSSYVPPPLPSSDDSSPHGGNQSRRLLEQARKNYLSIIYLNDQADLGPWDSSGSSARGVDLRIEDLAKSIITGIINEIRSRSSSGTSTPQRQTRPIDAYDLESQLTRTRRDDDNLDVPPTSLVDLPIKYVVDPKSTPAPLSIKNLGTSDLGNRGAQQPQRPFMGHALDGASRRKPESKQQRGDEDTFGFDFNFKGSFKTFDPTRSTSEDATKKTRKPGDSDSKKQQIHPSDSDDDYPKLIKSIPEKRLEKRLEKTRPRKPTEPAHGKQSMGETEIRPQLPEKEVVPKPLHVKHSGESQGEKKSRIPKKKSESRDKKRAGGGKISFGVRVPAVGDFDDDEDESEDEDAEELKDDVIHEEREEEDAANQEQEEEQEQDEAPEEKQEETKEKEEEQEEEQDELDEKDLRMNLNIRDENDAAIAEETTTETVRSHDQEDKSKLKNLVSEYVDGILNKAVEIDQHDRDNLPKEEEASEKSQEKEAEQTQVPQDDDAEKSGKEDVKEKLIEDSSEKLQEQDKDKRKENVEHTTEELPVIAEPRDDKLQEEEPAIQEAEIIEPTSQETKQEEKEEETPKDEDEDIKSVNETEIRESSPAIPQSDQDDSRIVGVVVDEFQGELSSPEKPASAELVPKRDSLVKRVYEPILFGATTNLPDMADDEEVVGDGDGDGEDNEKGEGGEGSSGEAADVGEGAENIKPRNEFKPLLEAPQDDSEDQVVVDEACKRTLVVCRKLVAALKCDFNKTRKLKQPENINPIV